MFGQTYYDLGCQNKQVRFPFNCYIYKQATKYFIYSVYNVNVFTKLFKYNFVLVVSGACVLVVLRTTLYEVGTQPARVQSKQGVQHVSYVACKFGNKCYL